ncbi:MAG: hypothetical protein LBQ89_03540 [Treponema sp.]|jgi:hypothetical protein|nr:hypothetical protein [Treponema sp.]
MIADFVVGKMAAYVASGMNPETAARFTRGELTAIYKGDHYSRDTSGAMRVTPPPETLDIKAAMTEVDAGIAEILDYCRRAGKVTETRTPESPGKKKTGLEGLENYLERHTA